MADRYIPKHPTTGWMLSELERLGTSMRGTDFTHGLLTKMLAERGYDVSASAVTKGGPKDDRRVTDGTPDRDYIPERNAPQVDLFTEE